MKEDTVLGTRGWCGGTVGAAWTKASSVVAMGTGEAGRAGAGLAAWVSPADSGASGAVGHLALGDEGRAHRGGGWALGWGGASERCVPGEWFSVSEIQPTLGGHSHRRAGPRGQGIRHRQEESSECRGPSDAGSPEAPSPALRPLGPFHSRPREAGGS